MFSVRAKIEDLGFNLDLLNATMIETLRLAVRNLAFGAKDEWMRLAQARLHTSRDDYINGLRQAESFSAVKVDGQPVFTIQLVGEMPNNFEFGMESFDMKEVRPGWLGGRKAKISKDGNAYIRIPFRHSPTSTTGIGYSGKAKEAGLQNELRNAIRDYGLDRMIKTATGGVAAGAVKRIPKDAPVHTYLQALTRIQEPTPDKKRARSIQYMTWRTMSEKSDPAAWIHPGLEAANLLPEVERWVDKELTNIVKNTLETAAR
jgi:hypothetical protein